MTKVLITGASGNVGSRIIRLLAARDVPVRAFVRRREPARFDGEVEVASGDYDDASSIREAMRGVDRVYLLTNGPDLARHEAALIDAASAAGVKHVVKHSVAGAQYEASAIPRWHRTSEKALEQSRLSWTFLRPSSFASNAFGWASTIRANGTVYGALGDAALPVIDPDDIAAAAAHVLTTSGHEKKAYELTGPEALTTAEQVAILSEVLGKKLAYVDVPDDAARKAMIDGGMAEAWVDAMVEMIGVLRRLGRVPPTGVLQELLGHPPRSFRAWAESNAAAFR